MQNNGARGMQWRRHGHREQCHLASEQMASVGKAITTVHYMRNANSNRKAGAKARRTVACRVVNMDERYEEHVDVIACWLCM